MMVLILVLIIVTLTCLIFISLFAPRQLPWYKPSLVLGSESDIQSVKVDRRSLSPVLSEGLAEPEGDFHIPLEEQMLKLGTIISEKNRLIEKLRKELAVYHSHREEFEKIKSILEEEIQQLKIQNKELKNKIEGGSSHA